MAVSMIGPKFYAWDRDGKPLAFGKVYTYKARTNAPRSTFQSEDAAVENTNPVVLNGEGYANIYLDGSYKIVVKDKDDNEIWTADPVSASGGEEWVNCMTATYLSSTTFKITGNVTDTFEVGRRVRIDNNAATYSYSTIVSAVFAGSETTITINDAVATTGLVNACISIIGSQSIIPKTIKTVADLRAFKPTKDFQAVEVLGHTLAGIGGGQFYYDPDDTTSADNNGTVIVTSNGERWKRKLGGIVTPEMFGVDEVVLYVGVGGSDANDGFSITRQLETIQKAFDNLNGLGAYFSGSWAVELSSGVFIESGARLSSGLVFENRLTIRGPDVGPSPNVPTAIIDGSSGISGSHAITINNSRVLIKNIKAVNFNHSDSSTGSFVGQNGADVIFENCHANGSSWFGCYVTASSKGSVKGGVYDGNRENIAFNASEGTVGYQSSSSADSPISKNATERGVSWTRGSQGHVDYVVFEDNVVGLAVDRNSRCADVACDFKRNTTAIQTRTGGIINGDKDNNYNIGGGDANTTIFDFGAYSGPQEELLDRTGVGFTVDARSEILIARELTLASHTGDTLRTVVQTPFTVAAGYFIDGGLSSMIGPKLRFKITGSRVNGTTGGLCSIGIQFGGNNINQWDMVGTIEDDWVLEVEVWSVGPTSQKITGTLTQASGTTPIVRHFGVFTRNIDMTVDREIEIDLQVADATDTLTIESIEIFRTG